jgi:hypothetical protein
MQSGKIGSEIIGSNYDYKSSSSSSSSVGVVGIVVALGAVLIGMYIIAIIVGSMGSTMAGLTEVTVTSTDSSTTFVNANSEDMFNIASILPIAIVGVGIMTIFVGAFAVMSDSSPRETQKPVDKTTVVPNTYSRKDQPTTSTKSDNNFITYGDNTKIEFSEQLR